MMKKLFIAAFTLAAVLPAAAQDTYENARLLDSDLNGTARYVGMGGAMDALGADISVIGTNPAGIGLFRHSTASVSFGTVTQQDARDFDSHGKTHLSLDQAGFVYSSRMDHSSFINFAFNYHKSRNFNQLLSATQSLKNASLNKLAYAKFMKGSVAQGGYELDWTKDNMLMGYEDGSDVRAMTYTQWDDLYMNAFNANTTPDNNTVINYSDADIYDFDRAHRGRIADFDFNLSGNSNDRFYWGITVGIHDVYYKHYSEYLEGLHDRNGKDLGTTNLADERKMTGNGFDVKAGIIFRPVEYSPFRIGLSVSTPTWYDLKTENYTVLYNNSLNGDFDQSDTDATYDYKFRTPWKFGLSMGHTVGNMLALGASIDYADYSSSDIRIKDGYDYYGNEDSYSDEVMKGNIEQALKGVATVKVGAELKPDPTMAVRLGYNYVSPMYEKGGVRDMTLNSLSVMYSSTPDYTNWKDTHRITCGLGYKVGSMNIDLAYQYSVTNGQFFPFQPNVKFVEDNVVTLNQSTPCDVSNKRHQVLLTLGYTF